MVADNVYNILVTKGLPCYVGQLPSSPDNVVAIMEYSNYGTVNYFGGIASGNGDVCSPLVKIVARNASYSDGSTIIESVKEALNKYCDDTLLSVVMVGSPLYLGRGESKLHEFQVTFKICVKE